MNEEYNNFVKEDLKNKPSNNEDIYKDVISVVISDKIANLQNIHKSAYLINKKFGDMIFLCSIKVLALTNYNDFDEIYNFIDKLKKELQQSETEFNKNG